MMQLITVITVVFNDVKNIEQTILSVLNQTYSNIEYIIIDGGSTDGTLDIIKKYSNSLAYWISEPDKGIYDAMNKGIDKANGVWVNFMNSGDIFNSKNVIYNMFNDENNIEDIIVGNNIFRGKVRHASKKISLIELYTNNINHQSAFIKKDLLNKYKYDTKYKISSDWKFFAQSLIIDNCSYKYVNIIVANYRDNGTSIINGNLLKQEKEQIMIELFNPRINIDYKRFKYFYWLQKNPARAFIYIWNKIKNKSIK